MHDGSIAALFAEEPDRLTRMSGDCEGIRFDFSKAAVKCSTFLAGLDAACDDGFVRQRERLFAGEIVNPSEGRAATHVAERGTGAAADNAAAKKARAAAYALADRVRSGGFGNIAHVLHVGIGGSALGPDLLIDALPNESGLDIAVVANIDGVALARAMAHFDPLKTLLVVASKTFTTLETITNANSALAWMRAGGVDDPLARTVALTANPTEAKRFGVAGENILGFATTVGGRYSLWSALGLPAMLALGADGFDELLSGAAAMDAHFRDAPPTQNLPLMAAWLDRMYLRAGLQTRAVFAYDERLRLLPSYLQQLEMESNGKRVRADGSPLEETSNAIVWGGVGTDAQHAVFQLLHQGTHVSPVEFVAVREPGHDLDPSHHRQLLANCFAQGAALMAGRSDADALAAADGDAALAKAKSFPGNRPSTTILVDSLSPRALGALLAFYEQRTFALATLLGINPFDQWGVELGKEIAKAVSAGDVGALDPSTRALMVDAGI
ncbi:MAG: glucose-6-phosphate isomerase [Pacificimonas sp.]